MRTMRYATLGLVIALDALPCVRTGGAPTRPMGPNKAAEILELINGRPSLPTALPVITQASFVWPITNMAFSEKHARRHILVITTQHDLGMDICEIFLQEKDQ